MSPTTFPQVQLVRLGRLGYQAGLKVQKYFQKQHLDESPNSCHTLLVVEHEPVYTLGFREKLDPEERERLQRTGAELIHSDRGGLTTFHGPGQLVVYPILHLGKFYKMSLRSYVSHLENVAVNTCRMLGVPAALSLESVSHTGAWANGNKICAIGVHCKRYVTTHGLALNCDVDLNWFKHIVPCGIQDKGVTSLSAELGEVISVNQALSQFIFSFESTFKCKVRDHPNKDYVNEILEIVNAKDKDS